MFMASHLWCIYYVLPHALSHLERLASYNYYKVLDQESVVLKSIKYCNGRQYLLSYLQRSP